MFPNVQENQEVQAPLGASSGPVDVGEFQSVNGIETYYASSGLNRASTTVCSLRSPNATSTLTFGSLKVTGATTTALFIEFGRSTVIDATTTSIGTRVLASGVQATMLASTSPALSAIDGPVIFPPNNYLNVKYGGALGSLNVLAGSCRATFLVN